MVALIAGCGARTSIGTLALVSSPSDGGVESASDGGVESGSDGAESGDSQDDMGVPPHPCKPGVLARGLLLPDDLALAGDDVYWVETGPGGTGGPSIQSCPKQGCTGEHPTALVITRASAIAVDGAELYWAEPASKTVNVCDVSSCVPRTLATLDDPPVALAIDGTDIYIGGYGSITRCSRTGPCVPTLLDSLGAPPVAVVLDASNVYFIDQAAGLIRACKKPNCDGGPRTVVPITDAYDLRVDDSNVYVSIGAGATDPDDAGAVLLCPKTGCAHPTPLATGLHHPATLALDAERVYWADEGTDARQYADGDVESCAKTGCGAGPKVHAKNQSLPASVAVDDACVYWASDESLSGAGGSVGSIDAVSK